jgi:hypothetical protein
MPVGLLNRVLPCKAWQETALSGSPHDLGTPSETFGPFAVIPRRAMRNAHCKCCGPYRPSRRLRTDTRQSRDLVVSRWRRSVATVRNAFHQNPLLRRRRFNTSTTIGRPHRKAGIQTQIQMPNDGRVALPVHLAHEVGEVGAKRRVRASRTALTFSRGPPLRCIHLLTSALSSFLRCGVTRVAMRAETVRHGSQSQHHRSPRRSPRAMPP